MKVFFLQAFSKKLDCIQITLLWVAKVWPLQVMVRSVYCPLCITCRATVSARWLENSVGNFSLSVSSWTSLTIVWDAKGLG